jgi:hypothetical protein
VVADANVLRGDLGYSCRTGRRTVLVTAANADSLRVFCAAHVIDEVFEHAPRWAHEQNIAPATYLGRWTDEYLPLIREVRAGDLPETLLTAAERSRIETLNDHDDRPSATLAIALGAYFLSTDRRALEVAYGPGVSLSDHDAWLTTLMSGGDAGELGKLIFGATALAVVAGRGAWDLMRSATRVLSPLLVGVALACGAAAVGHVYRDRGHELRARAVALVGASVEMLGQHRTFLERFEAASVPSPVWHALSESTSCTQALARACLFELARLPTTRATAAELAVHVPVLGGSVDEPLIRETLRG